MNIRLYYCMIVQDRLKTMSENLSRALPYVDRAIVVDGGSKDGSLQWMSQFPEIDVVNFPWCDNFVRSRNQYLQRIEELRAPDEISVYVKTDDDEFYSQFLLENLRPLVQEMLSANINQVRIRVKDVVLDRNGQRVSEELVNWYKPLITIFEPGTRYVGQVHETLQIPSGVRAIDLDDQNGQVIYEHRKRELITWPRGLRNFFIAGGGILYQDDKPQLWKDFRALIAKYGDFKTYHDFEDYLEKGNIAQEIKDWFIAYRLYGLPSYDAKYTEIREGFLTYFLWFHPEELPKELVEQDSSYMDYAAAIKRVHG